MDGGKQWWTHQFISDTGAPHAGVKVYTYAAGTTNDKPVYSDEAGQSALSQPVTGDAAGVVGFFADGMYKLKIVSAAGVALYEWDNVKITADTATMWEGNWGQALPAASTRNRGHLFAKLDGAQQIESLQINDDGTRFTQIPFVPQSAAYAGLPTVSPTAPGRLRRLTDRTRGLWEDTGTAWIPLNAKVANVLEFGAKGDGSVDDTSAIQDAVNQFGQSGGVVYLPAGTYKVTQVRLSPGIWLMGAGMGGTTIANWSTTQGSAGLVTNADQVNGDDFIRITDLTITRSVQISTPNYNEALKLVRCDYVQILRCVFAGSANGAGSTNRGITLDSCKYAWVKDCYFERWPDGDIFLSDGAGVGDGWITIENNHSTSYWNANRYFVNCALSHVKVLGNTANTTVVVSDVEQEAILVAIAVNVTDVLIANNQCFNLKIAKILGGNRVVIRNNQGTWSGIHVENFAANIADLVVQNNEIEYGSITIRQAGAFTITNVVVQGNKVTRNSTTTKFGIQVSAGSQTAPLSATVVGNHVSECQGGGIAVRGVFYLCSNNFCASNGKAGVTSGGMHTNFYFTAATAGYVQIGANLSMRGASNTPQVHYYFDSPPGVEFIDNETGGGGSYMQIDNCYAVNGAEPFNYVRIKDTSGNVTNPNTVAWGIPGGGLPAGTGSLFIRTHLQTGSYDETLLKAAILVKQSSPEKATGWVSTLVGYGVT